MARKRKRSGSAARGGRPRGAHAPKSTETGSAAPARTKHPLDNWLLGLAVLGIALTGYLTGVAWLGDHPAYCGADSACDIVQSSRWSTLLGMPMALWGLLTYAILARLVWRLRFKPSRWPLVLLFACIGAGVSWFLTLVSVLQIEATCVYCLVSFAIMNALFVLVLLRRPAQMPGHAWRNALPVPIGAALVVVLGLHLHYSGVFDPAAGPEDPYLKALAIHLEDSGARFYGAYWCPACERQKELFLASAGRLPYIECTPDGRGGVRAVACLTQDVQSYPTWIIDGQRYTDVMTPQRLARMSSFARDEATPTAPAVQGD